MYLPSDEALPEAASVSASVCAADEPDDPLEAEPPQAASAAVMAAIVPMVMAFLNIITLLLCFT